MDFTSICRTCLGTKYLNPIFKEGDDYDFSSFSSSVLITTGLKVEINDGLPQQICRTCMKFITDAVKFRQLCKDTEIQLLSIKNNQDQREKCLINTDPEKPRHCRKKTNDYTSSINIKIEPEFELDDDIPLLQQKLNFTQNLSRNNSLVKIETEFVKMDEIELEGGKESIKEEIDEDKAEIENEFTDEKYLNEENGDEYVNYREEEEIDNQCLSNSKIDESEPKFENDFVNNIKGNIEFLESEANLPDGSKYETEFLELHDESDTDEHLNEAMEIEYNMEIPKYNLEIPKHNMDCSTYKIKVPIKTDLNTPNQNKDLQMYNTSKKILKNRKNTKESSIKEQPKKDNENNSSIKKENPQIGTENLTFVSNLNIKENSQKDFEDRHFIQKDSNRVTCKICQKDLSRRSIQAHVAKSHPEADDRQIKCEICDMYVPIATLNKHKVAVHGKDCFKCRFCKTEYDTEALLSDHAPACMTKKRRQEAISERRKDLIVECDVCNKLMQKASLKLHKDIKHAGMGPVCEHCGHRFGNKFRLNEHLRAKHGYEKFKCSMCDFRSASSTSIKNHERRHRGEKPYVCEQCGAKFHAAHLLAQHRQSHRTERNMKCDQCPAAFKANNSLHMHKSLCHNTNTYQCPMCPRTYRARYYAVKHLRAVHQHTGAVGDILVTPDDPRADTNSPT